MSDIGLPWSAVALLAPLLLPWLAVPGALLAGACYYRRRHNLYVALLAGLGGAFALPWVLLLALFGYAALRARLSELTPLQRGGLLLGAGVVSVVLVLAAVSRAQSRRRAGN
ncbi:MAG TPA: hypothetical protein VEQ59_04670 [Polyangiaceae bacterium]|nr:hypothetical protein [Polyangiaceae bacterium]